MTILDHLHRAAAATAACTGIVTAVLAAATPHTGSYPGPPSGLLLVRAMPPGPEQVTVYTSVPFLGALECLRQLATGPAGSRCHVVAVAPGDPLENVLSAYPLDPAPEDLHA